MKIKYKVLNLYAGIGGNRKLWTDCEVTAVEINPEIAKIYQDFFPDDKMIIGDAHQYLLDHFKEFDFIWSSPPCPTHSKMVLTNYYKIGLLQYPDMNLYQEKIILEYFFKGKWVIENVNPYYKALITPSGILGRHLFWSNFNIANIPSGGKMENFIDAKYEDIQEWLGIYLKEKIYIGNSHDHTQILRNCVHPELGKSILNRARNIQIEENTPQGKLMFK